MTQMPPDLSRPYDSDRDRMADRASLTAYWYAIEPLLTLASAPSGEWPEQARNLVASFSAGSRTTDPADRLRRWSSLYAEEIALIRDARKRVVHGEIITDPELLGATWLARQVLATLAGIPPGQVDEDWVRSVAAQAAAPKALSEHKKARGTPRKTRGTVRGCLLEAADTTRARSFSAGSGAWPSTPAAAATTPRLPTPPSRRTTTRSHSRLGGRPVLGQRGGRVILPLGQGRPGRRVLVADRAGRTHRLVQRHPAARITRLPEPTTKATTAKRSGDR